MRVHELRSAHEQDEGCILEGEDDQGDATQLLVGELDHRAAAGIAPGGCGGRGRGVARRGGRRAARRGASSCAWRRCVVANLEFGPARQALRAGVAQVGPVFSRKDTFKPFKPSTAVPPLPVTNLRCMHALAAPAAAYCSSRLRPVGVDNARRPRTAEGGRPPPSANKFDAERSRRRKRRSCFRSDSVLSSSAGVAGAAAVLFGPAARVNSAFGGCYFRVWGRGGRARPLPTPVG